MLIHEKSPSSAIPSDTSDPSASSRHARLRCGPWQGRPHRLPSKTSTLAMQHQHLPKVGVGKCITVSGSWKMYESWWKLENDGKSMKTCDHEVAKQSGMPRFCSAPGLRGSHFGMPPLRLNSLGLELEFLLVFLDWLDHIGPIMYTLYTYSSSDLISTWYFYLTGKQIKIWHQTISTSVRSSLSSHPNSSFSLLSAAKWRLNHFE